MSIIVYIATLAVDMIKQYGYPMLALFMALESSSIPVPSEIVMPLAGALAARGMLNFWLAYIVTLAGSTVGMLVDYYIGLAIGKDVIYKHARRFRIKESSIKKFDEWFENNAVAAIFLTRLLPVVRTWMSFPAGFARMPIRRFLLYSVSGAAVWNMVLILFGFYALGTSKAIVWMASSGALAIVLYLIFRLFMKKMRK